MERRYMYMDSWSSRWMNSHQNTFEENVDVSALKITIAYAPVQTSFKDPKFQRNGVMSGENLESVMVLAIIAYLVDIAVTSRSCSRPPCSPHPPPMDDALAPTISALLLVLGPPNDIRRRSPASVAKTKNPEHLQLPPEPLPSLLRRRRRHLLRIQHRTRLSAPPSPLSMKTRSPHPIQWCKHINLFRQLLLVLNQTTICLLLALRIYALYGRRRKVWVYMLSSAAVLMGVSLWAISGHGGEPVPHVIGCHIANSKAIGIHLAVPWEALFTYDIIIVVALLYKSIQTRNQSGTMRSEPLLSLLIRDGAVYFVLQLFAELMTVTKNKMKRKLSMHSLAAHISRLFLSRSC
ncbi:hypothetical protein C8R46DRAFT_1204642 [Mycena filopes]|nr:hypothetical protein C8R46DRAFT_1204642 [Mycena filopes]